jgi:hypothetical protein
MTFSSKTCYFALVIAAAYNAITSAVDIGTAENYVILSKSGIDTVANSSITGDIAVSPIAATGMTGFSLMLDSSEEFSTSTQLDGQAFASNYATPTPTELTTAVGDMETAYTTAAGLPNEDAARKNINGGTLGGTTSGGQSGDPLTPGVYTFSTSVTIAKTIYFDGDNDDEAVFTMQIKGDLKQAANTQVILQGGALAKNVFWQVAGFAHVGADAEMKGILLVKTDALFETGSSLDGRVLAQTACNLQKATIISPSNE